MLILLYENKATTPLFRLARVASESHIPPCWTATSYNVAQPSHSTFHNRPPPPNRKSDRIKNGEIAERATFEYQLER